MSGLVLPSRFAPGTFSRANMPRVQKTPTSLVARRTEFDLDWIKQQIDALPDEMPDPTGYRLLVLQVRPKSTTDGGIDLPDDYLDKAQSAMDVGVVLAMGPDCYSDEGRFPHGPYCRTGDVVGWTRYAGSARQMPGGATVLILSDDQIDLVFWRQSPGAGDGEGLPLPTARVADLSSARPDDGTMQ